MIPEINLSSNDAHILTALFDPEAAPTATLKIDPNLPAYPSLPQSSLSSLQALEVDAIRPLNIADPSHDQIYNAIDALSEIIEKQPAYASAYANRAQVRRLAIGDALFTPDTSKETTKLFEDLETCIAHASPRSPTDALSPTQAKLLASVHTHRGYLLMKASTAAAEEGGLRHGPKGISDRTREELEEMASRDFFLGGRYGDRTAKGMSVRTNPYAKMCGAIVKEAMRKEMEEFQAAR